MAALPPFAAVIVAAGKGLRVGGEIPKQFANWRGKPLLRHSAERLFEAGARPIVVAIPPGGEHLASKALAGIEGAILVAGGATRQESVRLALDAIADSGCANVLIHDAARPDLPLEVIGRLISALDARPGAIPVLPVVDSIALADGGVMVGAARREELRRVQTPQAFRFADILQAHRQWSWPLDAGDDAQVAMASGLEVGLVEGDERLRKLTFAADFEGDRRELPRTGMGYDVHRLLAGEELWLCGLRLEHEKGLAGHSDADVALHSVVDAVLGAAGAGDIGDHFPPTDPQWKGAPSSRFVEHAVQLAAERGYRIANVDVTIICEAPKIGPYKAAMQKNLARLLGVGTGAVNVKATTTEGLGFTGRGEGIAAQAVATLVSAGEN